MALLPFILLITAISYFGVDILVGDEWIIWSNLLNKIQTSNLTLSDLIAQQNEQRLLSTRIFGLIIDRNFGLNRIIACYFNVLLALIMFSAISYLYCKTKKEFKLKFGYWPLVFISFLVFSFIQWETFFVGINNSILFPLVCLFLGFSILSKPKISSSRFIFALIIGILGSFHTASGLFYWLCIFFPLQSAAISQKRKLFFYGLTVFFGTFCWVLYFTGYQSPPHHPSIWYSLYAPFSAVGYFFVLLGKPFAGANILLPLACLSGLIGFSIFILTMFKLKQNSLLKNHLVAIWAGIIFYSLMAAVAITLSRCGFGTGHAMQSRYATHLNIFWIALIILLLIPGKGFSKITNKFVLPIFTVFVFSQFLFSEVYSVYFIYRRSKRLNRARQELFSLNNPQKLKTAFPFPNYIYRVLPLFFQQRQSIFRNIGQIEEYQSTTRQGGYIKSCKQIEIDGCKGWLIEGDISISKPIYILPKVDRQFLYAFKPESENHFSFFLPNHFFDKNQIRLELFVINQEGKISPLLKKDKNLKMPNLAPPVYDLSKKYFFIDVLKK